MIARFDSRSRRLTAALSLALFLAGSNNCLLGAWTGDRSMACMTIPGTQESSHGCCHPDSPAGKNSSGETKAMASCCPDPVVVPSTVAVEKDEVVSALPVTSLLAALAAPAPEVAPSWLGHTAVPDARPPDSHSRAPHPARAPPLA